jgi:hypothetical protein
MANVDAPFGFRPVESGGSGGSRVKLTKYAIAASEGTDLFRGDPVNLAGTSVLDEETGNYLPTVVRATAGNGNYTVGVIVDFVPQTDDSLTYKTDATTERFVLVADDPYQLFEVQADGSVAVTDIGNTADIIFTHAGSTITGQSGAELDTADIGTGKQLVIEGVSYKPNRNELGTANPVLLVRFSEHQKRNLTGV